MSRLRIAPWTWRHAITDKVVNLNPAHCEFDPTAGLTNHRLHDGLPRSHSFDKHINNTKRKSETTMSCVLTFSDVVYCEMRCKAARRLSDKLFTQFCNPDRWLFQPSILCQGIRLFGALLPLPSGVILRPRVLDMPKCPNLKQRPDKPSCPLQARLGWPSTETNNGDAVFAWRCQVRKFQLNQRYEPPT